MESLVRPPGIGTLDDAVDDYKMPSSAAEAERDVRSGKRAVIVHQAEQWPAGVICRNCHAGWPCRWYRWGLAVLCLAGWQDVEIAELVRQAENGELPWW